MKCIDCIYFLNCKQAEENKKYCDKYKTRYMQLVRKDGEIFEFERMEQYVKDKRIIKKFNKNSRKY